MFRVLHLLVELFNSIVISLLFLFLIGCGTSQIMSVVTIILHYTSMNFLLMMFFTITTLEATLIILVVYGFAGEFYRTSALSLLKLQNKAGIRYFGSLGKRERKYRERFLRSCQAQKVKFGFSNFIEKNTPPIFQLFCLNRIIDLLLLR